MEDASKAVADFNTRLGLTGPELQDISKQALQVSDMLGDDLNSVIESSSQAFQQWAIDTEDMGGAMDYIFKVSQSTGLGFTQIMDSMQKFGPQLQEMGYSFEGASALVGQLEKAGVNTDEVLGAMKKSVGALAKEGISASEGLDMYFTKIYQAGTAAEAASIAAEIFGTRAGSTMASAIRNGTLAVGDLTASLMESDETIAGAADDTYDFSQKMQMLKQKAQIALKPLANTIFDSLNKAMPAVERLMEKLIPIIEDVSASAAEFLDGAIEDIVSWVENFLPKVFDAIEWIGENIGLIKGIGIAIGVVAGAIAAVNTAMTIANAVMWLLSANPIVLTILAIVAAIAAVIAIIVLCIKHWDKIKAAVASVVDWIVNAWTNAVDWLGNAVASIGNFFSNLWSGIKQGVSDLVTGIKDFFKNGFESLVGIIKQPINAVIGIINGAIDGINAIGFDIPDWVPLIGGKKFSLNIPKIPMLATGGFTTGPSIAGEAGTEAVISFDPAYRDQNLSYWAQAGRMLGASASDYSLGGSSGSTTIDFGGVTFAPQIEINGQADKRSVMDAIEDEYPEFIDFLEAWLAGRGKPVYG
jgi:phage-related minor tail protein